MYARRIIISNRSNTHLTFRCHNRSFLFKDTEVKEQILRLWARYKKRYGIRIFDFNIMDNHAHLIARCENALELGNFMRTVNAQIAAFINKRMERDSQVIRERYKSSLICDNYYFVTAMDYVWVNRYQIDRNAEPDKDPFCSAAWRLNHELSKRFATDDEEERLFSELLDPYAAAGIDTNGDTVKFVRDRLNAIMGKIEELDKNFFTCAHTLGDKIAIAFRRELIRAYRRNINLSREVPT